jgi:hypothetical protein
MRTAWFLATISLMMASSAHAADSGSSAAVRFRTHVIEPDIANGYQTLIVDLNRDGKPDVIGLSGRLPALYWYENPGWERHVISVGHNRMITVAAADLNGDGIPELGLGTDFGQTESASEGRVYVLEHQGDPRQPWKATEIDRLPTTHRMRFADLDGDGKPELVNSPLTGKGAAPPLFECQTPLVYYTPADWKRHEIYDALGGVTHGMHEAKWDDSGRDAILTASMGGVWLHRAYPGLLRLDWTHQRLTSGDPSGRPKDGASEIRVGQLGAARFLATIEPWHGNQVVVYTADGKGGWQRHVIDDSFDDGHAVNLVDFNGDRRDEIVAGYRAAGAKLYVYYSGDTSGKTWRRETIDPEDMTAAGCDTADLNADGRVDLVCIGSRTANIKWYENLGPAN